MLLWLLLLVETEQKAGSEILDDGWSLVDVVVAGIAFCKIRVASSLTSWALCKTMRAFRAIAWASFFVARLSLASCERYPLLHVLGPGFSASPSVLSGPGEKSSPLSFSWPGHFHGLQEPPMRIVESSLVASCCRVPLLALRRIVRLLALRSPPLLLLTRRPLRTPCPGLALPSVLLVFQVFLPTPQ